MGDDFIQTRNKNVDFGKVKDFTLGLSLGRVV